MSVGQVTCWLKSGAKLGYDKPLFHGVNIDLREGEAVELRGRNGAGKTTVIKRLRCNWAIDKFLKVS